MATIPPYFEVIDFISEGKTPEEIIAFHPSAEAQERVAFLLQKNGESLLSEAEAAELDEHLQFDHMMLLLKARAS